jgi:hypothetical protein
LHWLTWVLINRGTNNPVESVGHLLEGRRRQRDREYGVWLRPCFCVGARALESGFKQFAETPDGVLWQAKLDQAYRASEMELHDILLAKRLAIADNIACARDDYGKPDPRCDNCGGHGLFNDSRDPRQHWDDWTIGGRWDGSFKAFADAPDDEIGRNIIRRSKVPVEMLPDAMVTPDGEWHEKPWCLEISPIKSDRAQWEQWRKEAAELLLRYAPVFVIVVDIHN